MDKATMGKDDRRLMVTRQQILTKYEYRLLKLCSDGKTHQEIADELHYSKWAIDRQLPNLYRKLGVDNKNDAIALVGTQKFK
jgi:DNA-binding CsgD family transcriptional regulator